MCFVVRMVKGVNYGLGTKYRARERNVREESLLCKHVCVTYEKMGASAGDIASMFMST